MTTILLSIGLVGAAFLLLALRIVFVRGGEFRGTCSTNNPYLRDEVGDCTLCGKRPEEECQRWNPGRWKRILTGQKGSSHREAERTDSFSPDR